jgi:hypothetical protein
MRLDMWPADRKWRILRLSTVRELDLPFGAVGGMSGPARDLPPGVVPRRRRAARYSSCRVTPPEDDVPAARHDAA